jgi:hypothetical protein
MSNAENFTAYFSYSKVLKYLEKYPATSKVFIARDFLVKEKRNCVYICGAFGDGSYLVASNTDYSGGDDFGYCVGYVADFFTGKDLVSYESLVVKAKEHADYIDIHCARSRIAGDNLLHYYKVPERDFHKMKVTYPDVSYLKKTIKIKGKRIQGYQYFCTMSDDRFCRVFLRKPYSVGDDVTPSDILACRLANISQQERLQTYLLKQSSGRLS